MQVDMFYRPSYMVEGRSTWSGGVGLLTVFPRTSTTKPEDTSTRNAADGSTSLMLFRGILSGFGEDFVLIQGQVYLITVTIDL